MSSELTNRVVAEITTEKTGLSSEYIAKTFLKFQATGAMAQQLVSKILDTDPRLSFVDGLWEAQTIEGALLVKQRRIICRCEVSNDRQSIGEISLWKLEDELLSHHKTISLADNASFIEVAPLLESEPLLFYSSYEQRLLLRYLLRAGFSLSDDILSLATLFKSNNIPMSGKKEGLVAVASEIMTLTKEPANCKDEGELLGELTLELLSRSSQQGMLTLNQFNMWQSKSELTAPWDKATFTLAYVESAGTTPGVYGFKDAEGKVLYVGKAKNLQRRLQTYFRKSDESPAKIIALRKESVTMMIHPCGSELEALIQEHRLIAQYQPKLNTMVQHKLNDAEASNSTSMLYVLRAKNEDSRMLLWLGKSDKIRLLEIAESDLTESLVVELRAFFNEESSSVVLSDEKIIALRWLKVHQNEVARISVDDFEEDEQLVELLHEIFLSKTVEGAIYR